MAAFSGMDTGGTGGGMEADLSAALGSAYDAATGSSDSGDGGGPGSLDGVDDLGADAGDESLESAGADLDSTSPDATVDVDPNAPGEEVPADPAASQSPWPLSEDGKTVLMPKGELGRVQAAMTYAEQVGQYFSSPQEAQVAVGQASDLRQMTNDWQYGSPETIQSFMNHWLGQNHSDPALRAACQRSFSQMIGMALPALKQLDPSAHSSMMSGVSKDLVSSLYDKAAQTGNPQDLLDAQSVDWGLNGTYQKELPKQDPEAARQAAFEAQQKEFTQLQEAAYKRDVQAFNSEAVEGAKFKQLDAAIDKQLEKVKSRFNPVAYDDLKAGIRREIQQSIASRGDWFTEHRQTYDGLIRDYRMTWDKGTPGQGLQPRVQSYIQSYLREAGRVLPAVAAKRVSATTQARVAGQNGQSKPPVRRPAAQNGRPSAPSQPTSNGRISSEQWDKELQAALTIK